MGIFDSIGSVFGGSKTAETERVTEKLRHIITLSRELHDNARWWYLKAGEPLTRDEIKAWSRREGVKMPEAYIACLTVANGFCVDYASTVGYFDIEQLRVGYSVKDSFSPDYQRMIAQRKPVKKCFGFINHKCLYYDLFSGEIFIEHKRYEYTPVRDFAVEILDPVIVYLETELRRQPEYARLLAESADNPMRALYDELMKYAGDGELPEMNIVVQPPAPEEEIVRWERENGMALPQEYRDWLKLSNGTCFANKTIVSLDGLRKELSLDPIDGVEYVIIAGISGSFDYLVFNSQTGDYAVLTEDFELEETAGFEAEIFEDGFEFLEDRIE